MYTLKSGRKKNLAMGKTLKNEKLSLILFLTLWMTYCLVAMTRNTASAAIATIVDEGIMTKSQAGLITAMFYLVYGILQIPGGMIADKYDSEKLIRIGLIGSAVSNAVIFINQSYPVMMAAWMFNAISQFALWPAVFRIISSQIAKNHRKIAVFYISIATSAGTALSYVVTVAVPKWQDSFLFSAIIAVVMAVIFNRVYRYMVEFMVEDTDEKITGEVTNHKLTKWQMFAGSGLLLILPVSLIREVVNSGLRSFAPVMLMESYNHVSPAIGNLFNIIIIISGIVGIVFVRSFLYPKRIKGELTGWLVSFGIALPFSGLMLLLGKTSVLVIVVFLSVIYAFMSAAFLFSNAWTQKFHKYGCEGTVAGIINGLACIGIVISSYGFGALAETTSNWHSTIWVWIAVASVMWRRFNKVNETKGENGSAQKL